MKILRPENEAVFRNDKMGKATLFQSPHLLVGLNAFQAGQSHRLHVHDDMDKMYYVVSGSGRFLLAEDELPMTAGDLLVAPAGEPHGIANPGTERLLVLAVLAPGPGDSSRKP
ncbi:MAG: cupin domain-containing protein [Acidobacteriota bacterium]